MPTSTHQRLLARYHYDPIDRLVDSAPFLQPTIKRFNCGTRLSTEIQGDVQRSIMQHDDQLLAQLQGEGGKVITTLLATDQQRSILNALNANQPHPLAYEPYGHRTPESGLLSVLGFTGERPDPVTGHYHLGSGYRQFNPVLKRFNSPDTWSPFGEGGLNAYMYCGADPINRSDPTGHFGVGVLKIIGLGLSAAGGGISLVGTMLDNDTTEYIGLGIMAAGTALFAGATFYKKINSRVTRIIGNRPPPSYDDLLPAGHQNLSRPVIVSADIEMHSLPRTSSTSSNFSLPPTYDEAMRRGSLPQLTSTVRRSTNQAGSLVAPSSSPRGSLQFENAANIRGERTN